MCGYPDHPSGAKTLSGKKIRVMSFQMASQLHSWEDQQIKVGDKLCESCYKKHLTLAKSQGESAIAELEESDEEIPDTPPEDMLVVQQDAATSPFVFPSTERAAKSEARKRLQIKTESFVSTSAGSISGSDQSQQLSQGFMPEVSNVKKVNEAMSALAQLSHSTWEPLKFISQQQAGDMSDRTFRKMKVAVQSAYSICASAISPQNDPDALLEQIQASEKSKEMKFSEVLEKNHAALVTAYKESSSKPAKFLLLKCLASKDNNGVYLHTRNELRHLLGCSKRQVTKARADNESNGVGYLEFQSKQPRIRIDLNSSIEFFNFLITRDYLRLMSWGHHNVKFDTGTKEQIGGILQTTISSHIIKQYKVYCEAKDKKPLSDRTCYMILNDVVAAKKSKAVAGIDKVVAAGSESIDMLLSLLVKIEDTGADINTIRELKSQIVAGKKYLKGAFVENCSVQEGSQVASHCQFLALSDPDEKRLQEQCNHDHLYVCEDCESLDEAVRNIESLVKEMADESVLFDFNMAKRDLYAWKSHILRSKHQDRARSDVLDSLEANQGLLIFDYAMKILPTKAKESQTDFYGKRGMSDLGFAFVRRNAETGNLEKTSYHIFLQSCDQGSASTAALYKYAIEQIKKDFPSLTQLYDKSDNAVSFHNWAFLNEKKSICKKLGVELLRTDFNDPYHGKDQVDREFAVMKTQLRIAVISGKDVWNVEDILKALQESPTKIPGAKYAIVELPDLEAKAHPKKPSAPVMKFHSIEYKAGGMLAWRNYSIGCGVPVKYCDPGDWVPSVNEVVGFTESTGMGSMSSREGRRVEEEPDETKVSCPEFGCEFQFHDEDELQAHLDLEKHSFDLKKETTKDKLKRLFLKTLQETDPTMATSSNVQGDWQMGESQCKMGFGLPVLARRGAFDENQVDFLKSHFEAGLIARSQKIRGDQAAKLMRTAKKSDGTSRFTYDEYLTTQQCDRFFTKLFNEIKKNKYVCKNKELEPILVQSFGFQSQYVAVTTDTGDTDFEIEDTIQEDIDAANQVIEEQDLQEALIALDGKAQVMQGDFVTFSHGDLWSLGEVAEVSEDRVAVTVLPLTRATTRKPGAFFQRDEAASPIEIQVENLLVAVQEPSDVKISRRKLLQLNPMDVVETEKCYLEMFPVQADDQSFNVEMEEKTKKSRRRDDSDSETEGDKHKYHNAQGL